MCSCPPEIPHSKSTVYKFNFHLQHLFKGIQIENNEHDIFLDQSRSRLEDWRNKNGRTSLHKTALATLASNFPLMENKSFYYILLYCILVI